MAKIEIRNKSGFDVSFLKEYADKIEPFLNLVDSSKYPFKVIVVKKKDFYDRSYFETGSNQLVLKIDLSKQSEEDVAWVLVHEFAHFLTVNNPELQKTCFDAEQNALEEILQEKFNIDPSSNQIHEVFHDFLPVEVAANFFATMIIGRFHKRHPFSNVKAFLRKNSGQNSSKKENSNRQM